MILESKILIRFLSFDHIIITVNIVLEVWIRYEVFHETANFYFLRVHVHKSSTSNSYSNFSLVTPYK